MVKETYEHIEEVPKKLPTMALDMAAATSPALSTVRTAYDTLPKQEGSALAGIFNDPKQLADHKNQAITLEKFLNYSQGKSLQQLQHEEDNLDHPASDRSGKGPDDKFRYVIDPSNPNRVIDMRHFLVVGPQGEMVGLAGEIAQGIPGMQDPTGSSFHNQDFFSNALGARFAEQYDKNKDLTSQLEEFFTKRIKP